MFRDSGLHAALALAVATVIGAILDHVGVGAAVGLLLAAVVTSRWPSHEVMTATERDET